MKRPLWTNWRWWFWAYRSSQGGWMVRILARWVYVKPFNARKKALRRGLRPDANQDQGRFK